MKAIVISVLLFGIAFSVEQSYPRTVVRGSLILPLVAALLIWFRNARGIVMAGCCLLADWIARPTFLPLTAVIVPLLAPLIASASHCTDERRSARNPLRVIPNALHVPLLTLTVVVLHQCSELSRYDQHQIIGQLTQLRSSLADMLLIAVPVSAALSLLVTLSDELGLRQRSRPWHA